MISIITGGWSRGGGLIVQVKIINSKLTLTTGGLLPQTISQARALIVAVLSLKSQPLHATPIHPMSTVDDDGCRRNILLGGGGYSANFLVSLYFPKINNKLREFFRKQASKLVGITYPNGLVNAVSRISSLRRHRCRMLPSTFYRTSIRRKHDISAS